MIATWRLGLTALCAVAVYFLTQRVLEVVLLAIRRRIGKRFRWVGDFHRHLLVYLSWIIILLCYLLIAASLLELGSNNGLVLFISYVMAIPLVLGTFALRIVVTNMIVRHFKWDRASTEYDAKIFVVTEIMKCLCFILIIVEIFYIFFLDNSVAGFLVLEVFVIIEIILLLSGFTMLKNIATGLFLVFAEPFRTGSLCRILHLRGFVERVSLARTIMRRADGALVYIPNGIFSDNKQTNGSPSDAFHHEVSVQLPLATPIQSIRHVRDDLMMALLDFSAAADEESSSSISGYRLSTRTLSSSVAETHTRESVSSMGDPQVPRKALQIGLSDMHRLNVRMTIEHSLFTSLEAAKTEINLAILSVFEIHRIAPLLLRGRR